MPAVVLGWTAGCDRRDDARSGADARRDRPNVVWIVLDACRADRLGSYGYGRDTTPSIDALARRGTVFEQNFAQAPNTLASVPSYLTGRHAPTLYQDPRHLQLWFLRSPAADEKLAPLVFAANGYATAGFSGSPWYSEASRLARGFEHFVRVLRGDPRRVVTFETLNDLALDWAADHADRPFFLYLHAMETHSPHPIGNSDDRWLPDSVEEERAVELRLWDTAPILEEGEEFTAAEQEFLSSLYDGSLRTADAGVGALVEGLRALGLLDDTIIVVSSDHGELVGEDGTTVGHPSRSVRDAVYHVPLIFAGPGVPAGRRVSEPTENADILPTLVELLDLTTEARFDGVSLVPAMNGDPSAAPLHEYVFARFAGLILTAEPRRIYMKPDHKVVLEPPRGAAREGRVYARPDRDHAVAEIAREDLLTAAARYDAELFEPVWARHVSMEFETPPVFEIKLPPELVEHPSVTTVDDPTDNLWGWVEGRRSTYFEREDILVARPLTESVPEVEIVLDPVPRGRYNVELLVRVLDEDPMRDTAVRVAVFDEPEPRTFSLWAWHWFRRRGRDVRVQLGTYTVDDGTFRLRLAAGSSEANAVVGKLRFANVDAEGQPQGQRVTDREQEALRALGYLE